MQPTTGKHERCDGRSCPWPVAAAIAALAGFAAVYVTLGRPDNAVPRLQRQQPSRAGRRPPRAGRNPLSHGADGGLRLQARRPRPCPRSNFSTASGKERTLADWRGKVVLLNLWATWCAPCRKEMPALDRLQAALGSDKFQVVALASTAPASTAPRSSSTRSRPRSSRLYADPTARMEGTTLKVARPADDDPDRRAKAARSAASSAPPNGTARTPSG